MKIRPATEQDIPIIAGVHVASWLSSYRGIVPDSYLDALSHEKHVQRHQRIMAEPGKIYFVAESFEHGIVGFISGGPNRTDHSQFTGELYALYILAEHQRKGIGRALVRAWAAKLLSSGINSALVWVLADNKPAIAFYQRLGGIYLREESLEIDGSRLREFAYGWDHLRESTDDRHFIPPD
jgi:ribosomal protein S18 acetylase RimI-like enzyme